MPTVGACTGYAAGRRRSISWRLNIPAEVRCEYAGTQQGDYYTHLDAYLETELAFPARFARATGYRPAPNWGVPVPAYEGVAALGGELIFPAAHQPMIRNQGRIVETPKQVEALRVPDPRACPRFQENLRRWHELRRRLPGCSVGLSAGQEGPVTTAVLLRGTAFFEDCLVDPESAHRLLSVCTDTYVAFARAVREATGAPDEGSVAIADDHAGNLSPAMWPQFVLPYYERIYDQLGATRRSMHTELVRREHLPLLASLGLDHVNFGENQYLAVREVADALQVPFDWHIKAVSEMLQGTPAQIQAAYHQAVADGAPAMACELTVGTPPENIRAFLSVARAYEEAAPGAQARGTPSTKETSTCP
jgi:uroporphyrinogen-III decarboxylase